MIPLDSLLKKSASSPDPAKYLYQNKARDILFRLEALSRIYRSIHNKKSFSELRDDFKELEDQLGVIDFYDAFEKEFSRTKSIPSSFLKFFRDGTKNGLADLNELLKRKKLPGKNSTFIGKVNSALTNANWLPAEEDRQAVGNFIVQELDKFKSQYESGELNFESIEDGVHEFRRKLRWFSIYAASLNGLIQLKKVRPVDENLDMYLTPEIVSSPFNILPKPVRGIKPIYIQSHHFYALSWIINEMGRLKDEGLRQKAITNAIESSGMKNTEGGKKVTKLLLSNHQLRPGEICAHSEMIADRFIYRDRVTDKIKRDVLRSLNT